MAVTTRIQHRGPFGFAAAAFVSCFVVAIVMRTQPMMVGGRRPTIGEALAMVSIPALASAGAVWAASRRRRVVLAVLTGLLGLFSVVTGFSIGSAFAPAFALLVYANIASLDDEPPPDEL